jgi:hypothetical protein
VYPCEPSRVRRHRILAVLHRAPPVDPVGLQDIDVLNLVEAPADLSWTAALGAVTQLPAFGTDGQNELLVTSPSGTNRWPATSR